MKTVRRQALGKISVKHTANKGLISNHIKNYKSVRKRQLNRKMSNRLK